MNNEIIKVFVGCDPNNCDLEQMMVLDYSIHKHTSSPIEIIWMQLSRDPDSFWYSNPKTGEGWNTSKWATPFSGFRWAIPEYCNFSGKAIYMDVDVMVLSDLTELWNHAIEGPAILAAKAYGCIDWPRLCTCIWNCNTTKDIILPIEQLKMDADSHQKMLYIFEINPNLIEPYQDSYNCVDGEDLAIQDIKILHYSDMGMQFSHKYSMPRLKKEGSKHWFDGKIGVHPRKDLIELFDSYYNEALTAGYELDNYRVVPFGKLEKQTQINYKGNRITHPVSFLSRLSKYLYRRLFKY